MPHLDSNASVVISISEVPKPTIQNLIVLKAKEYGLNPHTALAIAKCESNFNPLAQNKYSSAGGVFQFIDGTWTSVNKMRGVQYNKFNAEENIDNAMWLAKKEGWQHWECLYMI